MNSDLFIYEEDKKKCALMHISMSASQALQISIIDKDALNEDCNKDCRAFILQPNEKGRQEAKKLILILQSWIEHTEKL
jgi:hypothetical protein